MLTYNFANQILNLMTGKTQSVSAGNITVGLSSSTPTREGTGYTEPSSGTGYERVLLGSYTQSLSQLMGTPDEGVIKNTKNIFFPKAVTNYASPITHFLIFNGNTLIAYGALNSPITPLQNSVPVVEINNLELNLE